MLSLTRSPWERTMACPCITSTCSALDPFGHISLAALEMFSSIWFSGPNQSTSPLTLGPVFYCGFTLNWFLYITALLQNCTILRSQAAWGSESGPVSWNHIRSSCLRLALMGPAFRAGQGSLLKTQDFVLLWHDRVSLGVPGSTAYFELTILCPFQSALTVPIMTDEFTEINKI